MAKYEVIKSFATMDGSYQQGLAYPASAFNGKANDFIRGGLIAAIEGSESIPEKLAKAVKGK
jgi:hypothetical protein